MGTGETILILIIIFVVFLALMFLTWLFSDRARNNERMRLIEKGIDVSTMDQGPGYSFPWLKLGIVVLGIGVGLLIITILAANDLLKGSGALPMSILTICGGVSLIIAHYASKS